MLCFIAIYTYNYNFMQIQETVLELWFFFKNENEPTFDTINIIGPGGESNEIKTFFHRFQIFDFESLGSIAAEILSVITGTAAEA